jgi:hypothetical protein
VLTAEGFSVKITAAQEEPACRTNHLAVRTLHFGSTVCAESGDVRRSLRLFFMRCVSCLVFGIASHDRMASLNPFVLLKMIVSAATSSGFWSISSGSLRVVRS